MKVRRHFVMLSLGTALSGCVVAPDTYQSGVTYGPGPAAYAPPTPRIRYLPADYRTGFVPAGAYVWIDDADGFAQAIGDAPPDYSFRFDGRDAWAWVSQVGEAMIIERSAEGIVQYYFAPNAAAPYLVRDIFDSYGFDGPDLAVIYDSRGGVVTTEPSLRTLATAERLLDRGRAIRGAALDRRWDRDSASYWSGQSFVGYAFGDSYARGWSGSWQPVWRDRRDWQDERSRHRDREVRRRLDDEHRARADHGRRFREWRRRGGNDAPPAMAPVAPPTDLAPPSAAPRPPRPPRTDVVAPVPTPGPTPAPVAPPAATPRPARPPRNLVDPVAGGGVRPLPEVPVSAEPSPALPPSRVETSVDEENPAVVAPRPPRAAPAARRPDMMPSSNRGGPEPATIPPTAEPPLVDQAERDAMAMRRQLLEEERREREAAAEAERQILARQAAAEREAEAARQAERDSALQREMLARREAAEAAMAARAQAEAEAQAQAEAQAREQAQAQAEAQARANAEAAAARAAAARAGAEAAARAAAAAAAREASQPRVRTNNVDEEDTQPQ